MRQRFFTDTIQSKFIKALVGSKYVPNYNTINDCSYLIQNNYYLNKNELVKCTNSGYFKITDIVYTLSNFVVADNNAEEEMNYICTVTKTLYNKNVKITSIKSENRLSGSYGITKNLMHKIFIDSADKIFNVEVGEDAPGEYQIFRTLKDIDIELITFNYSSSRNSITDLSALVEENIGININMDTLINACRTDFMNMICSYDYIQHYEYGAYYPKWTEKFSSRYNYYDSETHIKLGEFLRFYRDYFDINLMPFYNCVSGEYISDYVITPDTVLLGNDVSHKVLKVPIKFNTTYTIAIDSSSKIYMAPIFLDHNNRKLDVHISNDVSSDLSSYLKAPIYYNSMSFKKPITFRLENMKSNSTFTFFHGGKNKQIPRYEFLNRYENNLYLLIQLSIENNSSIVVLEGDYTKTDTVKHYNLEHSISKFGYKEYKENISFNTNDLILYNGIVYQVKEDISSSINTDFLAIESYLIYKWNFFNEDITEQRLNELLLSNLSLLQLSDNVRYPLSDRLIEYLLLNVITNADSIENDVLRVQEKLNVGLHTLNVDQNISEDVWNSYLRELLYNQFMDANYGNGTKYSKLDTNGFVDKNIEYYLNNL